MVGVVASCWIGADLDDDPVDPDPVDPDPVDHDEWESLLRRMLALYRDNR